MEETMHISAVCKLLDTTSRTIRYYEQLGLIQTNRADKNAPRRLDRENTEQLRKILFLRKIGLSLDEIQDIVKQKTDVTELIRSKSVSFQAEISELLDRIRLLDDVLRAAENGEDIYTAAPEKQYAEEDAAHLRIAAECTKMLLERRFAESAAYLHPKLQSHLSPAFTQETWDEFIEPCGTFLAAAGQKTEGNIVHNRLHFEKTDISVRIGFLEGKVIGIIFQYRNQKEN